MLNKLKTLDELWQICRVPRPFTMVWTNGCFDILHAGHVEYLQKARDLGNMLVVGLNSDESIKKLKGNDRPIVPFEHRAKVLSAIESVDFIVPFETERPLLELETLKPNIFVKGDDYSLKTINKKERKIIQSYNGQFKFISSNTDISTTWIIKKINSLSI